ncbi:MAG: hypothetical protein Q8R70_06500, partial [Methanoregula sp.]|nr:hypothetical protein [Methanoregula sp.]
MASQPRYEIAFFFIVFFIISSVSAVPQNGSLPGDEPGTKKAPYSIVLFIPSPNQIHSDEIKDQINSPNGDVLIATAFGLSTYNGTWSS